MAGDVIHYFKRNGGFGVANRAGGAGGWPRRSQIGTLLEGCEGPGNREGTCFSKTWEFMKIKKLVSNPQLLPEIRRSISEAACGYATKKNSKGGAPLGPFYLGQKEKKSGREGRFWRRGL